MTKPKSKKFTIFFREGPLFWRFSSPKRGEVWYKGTLSHNSIASVEALEPDTLRITAAEFYAQNPKAKPPEDELADSRTRHFRGLSEQLTATRSNKARLSRPMGKRARI